MSRCCSGNRSSFGEERRAVARQGTIARGRSVETAIFVEGKDGIERHTQGQQRLMRMAVIAIRRSISAGMMEALSAAEETQSEDKLSSG